MSRTLRLRSHVFSAVALVSLIASSCAPASPSGGTTSQPTAASSVPTAVQPTDVPTDSPTTVQPTSAVAETADTQTDLRICVLFNTPMEEPWNIAWMNAFERLGQSRPHGLTVTIDHTENVTGDDAERVLRQYADTGKCDIIWGASAFSDQVKNLYKKYPEIPWVVTGGGNEPMGENGYWVTYHLYEASYLLGIIAGKMTQSNVVGAVAAYPVDTVNDAVNGFVAGAKSVNPKVVGKVTYIESWFDPPKAKEAAYAQVAAGADFMYAQQFGVSEVCKEKGIYCFGEDIDLYDTAPDVILSGTMLLWDPTINYIVDEWWNHVVNGKPYNAPTEPVWFGMKDGASDIAPFHDHESKVPQDVKNALAKARADIKAGTLKVELNTSPFESK